MEWLKIQIFKAPKAAHLVGRGFFSLGGFLLIAGLIGQAGMLAINATRKLSKLGPLAGLTEAYPTLPLWWVPEGPIGYAAAAALAAAGIYVALLAGTILKATGGRGSRRYG
jgi:hypothetical protein